MIFISFFVIMKEIRYNPEKREKILNERGIDLDIVAHLINEWKIITIAKVPSRTDQKMFVLLYHDYVCCIPYVENEEEIFLKTAYLSRKMNKLLNNNH